jgi:hypothetical protein
LKISAAEGRESGFGDSLLSESEEDSDSTTFKGAAFFSRAAPSEEKAIAARILALSFFIGVSNGSFVLVALWEAELSEFGTGWFKRSSSTSFGRGISPKPETSAS